MRNYWNFPSTIGGNISSINHAGLETFRGNALESMTREICQNSLDANLHSDYPVIIEFSDFEIDSEKFPGRNELIDDFKLALDTWQDRNRQSEKFIKEALACLSRERINMLRISDFNTKGLEGAEKSELSSPWSSLIKEAGSSNKDKDSGGSFGIGKAAPFLNSKLRTLFYSSLDVTRYPSHIGVANIMSFKKPDDTITLGTGYYTNNEQSTAIYGQLSMDPNFVRNETGTDIYVMAFEPQGDWEAEVIKSVLFNFFITILNNKLVVRVNGFEINKNNIVGLIDSLEDTKANRELKQYCEILISKDTVKIAYPEMNYKNGINFQEGEAQLYLINGENLNRRVLMTRKTGMRIFEQGYISGNISFSGIFTISGFQMNEIFKEMENPEHNKWEPNRYEKDPKLADKIFKDVRDFFREKVREEFQEEIMDEMDAVGLNDFLPNRSLLDEGSQTKEETLSSSDKSLKRKKYERRKHRQDMGQGEDFIDVDKELAGEFGTGDGDKGGSGLGEHQGGEGTGGGTSDLGGDKDIDRDKAGDKEKELQKRSLSQAIPITQRSLSLGHSEGKYRLNIVSDKPVKAGRIVFYLVGEQNNFTLPIKSATILNNGVKMTEKKGNVIHFETSKEKKSLTIDLTIDYSEYCVLEAKLYEY